MSWSSRDAPHAPAASELLMSATPDGDQGSQPTSAGGRSTPSARVCIVTNGSWFATSAIDRLVTRTVGRYEYLVIVTTGLREQSENRLVEGARLLARWGVRYFAYKATVNILPSAIARVTSRGTSVETVCRRLHARSARFRNLNDPEPLDCIRNFNPDLLVSFSCPYRLSAQLLGLPRIGALNVHSSLLPAYAGVATYVHCLASNDVYTGVTVHEMVERFDAGRILRQRRIEIEKGTSVFRLFLDQCMTGSALLEEAIEECSSLGRVTGHPQNLAERSYFGEPTRTDIRRLRRNGFHLMRLRDFAQLFERPSPFADETGGRAAAAAE